MGVEILAWNWPAFASAYLFVFIMELLDNTQLIQVYYSSKYGRQWLLALASWSAFLCTGLIGASFSGLRTLSSAISQVFELIFALVLLTLGIITLSHSEILVRRWEQLSNFVQKKIADPFLYSMGETKDTHIELKEDEGDAEMGDLSAQHVEGGGEIKKNDKETEKEKEKDKEPETHTSSVPEVARSHIAWWKLYILVFVTVFVLELPDKTMLMVASLAQSSDFPSSIFVGYATAMMSQSIIALIVGKGIARGAERFGEYIEMMVGVILTATGITKLSMMIFLGEFSFDDIFGKNPSSSSEWFFNSSSSLLFNSS